MLLIVDEPFDHASKQLGSEVLGCVQNCPQVLSADVALQLIGIEESSGSHCARQYYASSEVLQIVANAFGFHTRLI